MIVRKLLAAALLLTGAAACHNPPRATGVGGPASGAATPRAAIDGFLHAVKSQDLQAMSTVWGNAKGPARDAIERNELEKRELIMQCYLSHDSYQVVGADASGQGGRRIFRVALTRNRPGRDAITRETKFTTIEGPATRWYVEDVDLAPAVDLCKAK
jgi:hypothetical protein